MKRLSLVAMIILVSVSAGLAADGQIQETLDQLKTALNKHDFDSLRPLLAGDFSYDDFQGSMAINVMQQVVAGYPRTIQSISIEKVEQSGDRIKILAAIDLGDETETKEIVLSGDYKIIEASVVQIQVAGHGQSHQNAQEPAPKLSANFPEKMEVPFDLAGNLIMVKAEVEGVAGRFLVDTGAVGFMLNERFFEGMFDDARSAANPGHGVNGEMTSVKQISASNFKWQGLELDSVESMLLDLTHLEEAIGEEFVGVIGSDLLSQFTLLFEYDRKVLTLLSGEKSGSWEIQPTRSIDLEIIGHIPVFEASIGRNNLKFGIDCGAGGAMLFTKWEDTLRDHYRILGQENLNGADQRSKKVNKVELSSFEVEGISYQEHGFVIADLVMGHEPVIDGLVGYEFLRNYKTAIDIKRQKLYIWDM